MDKILQLLLLLRHYGLFLLIKKIRGKVGKLMNNNTTYNGQVDIQIITSKRFVYKQYCVISLKFWCGKNTNNWTLRLPHRNDAKIAKIHNLWTFWPVIRPINHLFKIRQKAQRSIDVKCVVRFLMWHLLAEVNLDIWRLVIFHILYFS